MSTMFKPSPTPPVFQPLQINPLHQVGQFPATKSSPSRVPTPLFLKSASPSPIPRSLAASPLPYMAGPQRSSSLKVSHQNKPYSSRTPSNPSSQDVYTASHSPSPISKRTVRWASPLEAFKPIPRRNALDDFINNVESFVANEWIGKKAMQEPTGSVAATNQGTSSRPQNNPLSTPPTPSNETSHTIEVSFEDIAQNRFSHQETYETPPIFESKTIAAPKPRRPQELVTRMNLLHMQQIHNNVTSPSFLRNDPPGSAHHHITSLPTSVGNSLHSSYTPTASAIATNPSAVAAPDVAAAPISPPNSLAKEILREHQLNITNNTLESFWPARLPNNGNQPSTSRLPLPTRINGNISILGKRRPSSPDLNKRPAKAYKTDVDSSASLTGGLNDPPTKFPSLEPLEDALDVVARTPPRTPPPAREYIAHPLQSDNHEPWPIPPSNHQQSRHVINVDDDGDVEMHIAGSESDASDDDSLFGDHELLELPHVEEETPVVRQPISMNTTKERSPGIPQLKVSRKELEEPVSLNQTRRPLTLLKVVEWTNQLKTYDFLIKNNKFTWKQDNELYKLLETIDAEKDNSFMTPRTFQKHPLLPRLVKELKRYDLLETKTKQKLKNIARFWRRLLRDAPE